jgi:formylglycine-generating enzyme required for sulfatase activity
MHARICLPFCLLVLLLCLPANESIGQPIADDDFVEIKGGCFQMGDQFGDGLPDELPVHRVCLSDFHLLRYEVTQEQWQDVMGDNPSHNQTNPKYPIDVVNYHEVERFIERLNAQTNGKFRLPSEAEWEYACRSGGKKVRYGTADGTSSQHLLVRSVNDPEHHGVRPVGSFPANELGLHDMSGNVSEWVLDWYDREFYAKSPVNDPRLLEDRTKRSRVRRGGYWGDKEWVMRCTFRNLRKPSFRLIGLGFRLAKDP